MIVLSDTNCNSWLLKVFQIATNNFEILFLASINRYKPETNLTVLFARKIFISALMVELRRFFIEKSY